MKGAQILPTLRVALLPRATWRQSRIPLRYIEAYRGFQTATALQRIQTHVLSDIGEGVKEVQIIQWFVEEGAAIEEWAPVCEVQSDKASVEITSKYTGIIKKLHFERDAIVQVGDAMVDIEVEGEAETEDGSGNQESVQEESKESETQTIQDQTTTNEQAEPPPKSPEPTRMASGGQRNENRKSTSIATPAVRGLLKEHNLDITDIEGSGKDGRVLKEDIYQHLNDQSSAPSSSTATTPKPDLNAKQVETKQNLSAIQSAMFKSMTKSLSIPHFLFSDSVNISALIKMRQNLNVSRDVDEHPKFTYLPFIVKAVSLALNKYPLLNARLDAGTDNGRPTLVMRSSHNIGIAMDTPAGLLVPVIKNVNARSIISIANEIARLSELGQAGKLSNADLSGGTITVSNIGNIGGEVVGPVIVEGQLAILGIGKIKATPVFADDGQTIQRVDLMSTSWSADHRVIDGATMARAAKIVQRYLEHPESMLVTMS